MGQQNQAPQRLDVFTVVDRGEGKDSYWCRIGSAWVCKDGSLNVLLDAVPVNGSLNIREPLPPRDELQPQQQQQRGQQQQRPQQQQQQQQQQRSQQRR